MRRYGVCRGYKFLGYPSPAAKPQWDEVSTGHRGPSKLLLVDLNSYNHCVQHLADAVAYHEALTAHCLAVMASNEFVEDAITGKHLDPGLVQKACLLLIVGRRACLASITICLRIPARSSYGGH